MGRRSARDGRRAITNAIINSSSVMDFMGRMERAEKNPIGAGELSLKPPMGPVMANAIYDAAGARMTQLPTTPVRIKVALARV